MSQEREARREVACVVVAVGNEAFRHVNGIPRTGYWRLIAVGDRAAVADADRTILPDHELDPYARSEHAVRDLEGEWCDAQFVCVVYDERDLECSAFAGVILSAARASDRVVIALLLGNPCPCVFERRADLTVRPLTVPGAPIEARADALRTLLGPFESCWIPHDLDDVATAMKDLGEREISTHRALGDAARTHLLSDLLSDPTVHPHFVHVTLGPNTAPGIGDLTTQLQRLGVPGKTAITASLDETFAAGEILVGAIGPHVHDSRGGGVAEARLRALVAERGAAILPRDDRAQTYATRLAQELEWWTALEGLSADTLTLIEVGDRVRAAGGIVGPGIRRPGGSLVAYVLGLSVFDPIVWDLSFNDFRRPNPFVLELTASQRTCAQHQLPVYPSESSPGRRWAFYPDSLLDHLEDVAPSDFSWRMEDDRDATALASVKLAAMYAGRMLEEQSFEDYGAELAQMAPRTLEEVAAAVAIIRPSPIGFGLLDGWLGDGSPTDAELVPGIDVITKNTRGLLIYREQVTAAIAGLLSTTSCRADVIRRALPKNAQRDVDFLRLALPPHDRERVVDVLRDRSASCYSRGHALSGALVWLSLLRETTAGAQ